MKFEWRKMFGSCVGAVVFACLLNFFLVDGEVNAAVGVGVSQMKCSDVMGGKVFNPSLAEACSKWEKRPDLYWGAIWISNMKKEKEDGSYNKDYLASKVTMDNGAIVSGNKLTVYLRGAIIGSDSRKAECIDIKVKNGNNTYKPFTFTEKNHENGMCTITNVDEGPNYGKTRKLTNYWVDRTANGSPKTSNITFAGTTMFLDLTSINDWASVASRRGGHIDYNNVNVTIFRCQEKAERTETDHCYDNNSALGIDLDLIKANASVRLMSDSTKSASTGETIDTSKEVATLMLDGCESGCQVEFRNTIKKALGTLAGQKIFYNIKDSINRADNTWTDVKNLVAGVKNTFTENDVDVTKVVTLFPGEVLCRKMNFGLASGNNAIPPEKNLRYVRVCAAARGTLKTSVSLSASKEQDGASIVQPNENENIYLVQPGKFKITTSYTSNVQKALQMRFSKVELGNILFSPGSWEDGTKTLEDIMSSNGMKWKNELRLSTGRNWNYTNEYQTFPAGSYCGTLRDTLTRGSLGKNWTCTKNDVSEFFDEVGREYTVGAKTNAVDDAKTVPSQINFARQNYDGKSYFRAKISYDSVESSLKIRVPYNFKNSTWVDGGEMKIINLESGFDVKYYVRVGKRKNGALDAEYATQVDNATSGVYWCKARKDKLDDTKPDDVCDGAVQTETYDVDKNKEGFELETLLPNDDEQNPNYKRPISIGLKDKGVEVGDIICVWSWVTPGDSLVDLQMSNEWKNNTAYSWDNKNSGNKKVCGQIGKSPTIQVWGGNVLSKGQLVVSPVKEKTIKEKTRWFGSFGELGVFAGDSGNFANGAALGYRGIHQWNEDSKNVLLPSYLGRNKEDSEEIGGGSERSMGGLKNTSGIDGVIREIEDFANALDGKYCSDGSSGCLKSGEVSVDICGGGRSCSKNDDNNTIIINSGQSLIVDNMSNDKVTITTNVQYEDKTGGYGSFSEVPRFIVIANNIEIGCEVTRIDGLLVARGTVNTCKSDTPEDREKGDHSNQLIVNGAIIANRLVANRTYGAGPGIYSIVPAEIVRFDPTLLDLDLGSNDSNPKIVNITELPPRY